MEELFEQLDFTINPVFETIIENIQNKKFSIIDDFFSSEEVIPPITDFYISYK